MHSACHCTPTTNSRAGASIASITPSADARDRAQPATEPVDRLVVEGVDLARSRAEHAARARCRRSISTSCVTLVAGLASGGARPSPATVGQVLVQRPAARDVQGLRAAADREDRQAARVARAARARARTGRGRARSGRARDGAAAVGGRVEVGPAGQADAVEPLEQRLDRLGVERRQDHRDAAGALDRPQVPRARAPARAAAARPAASARRRSLRADLRRRDADQRPRARLTPAPMCPSPLRSASELTTSAPASSATRVRPPGSDRASPAPQYDERRAGRRGAARAAPSTTVGWVESSDRLLGDEARRAAARSAARHVAASVRGARAGR